MRNRLPTGVGNSAGTPTGRRREPLHAPLARRRGVEASHPEGSSGDQILTTRVGLNIPPDLPFDLWQRAGQHISRVVDSSAWCLGDWLVYGQERYNDRYRRAVDAVGLDYQTLRNYAWVTRRFDLSRRRDSLSFQHHAEVASLVEAEQERWLNLAEEREWSRNQLRRAVRDNRQQHPEQQARSAKSPRLVVPPDRVDAWRKAAELAESELNEWVVETLDRAAAHVIAEDPPVLLDVSQAHR